MHLQNLPKVKKYSLNKQNKNDEIKNVPNPGPIVLLPIPGFEGRSLRSGSCSKPAIIK